MAASGYSLFLPRALIKTFMEIWHDDVVKFRTCRSLSILEKKWKSRIRTQSMRDKRCFKFLEIFKSFEKFIRIFQGGGVKI